MESRWRVKCKSCSDYAEIGDLVWPREKEDGTSGYIWLHFTCAEALGMTSVRPVCKHFARGPGRCQYGETCFFLHESKHAVSAGEMPQHSQDLIDVGNGAMSIPPPIPHSAPRPRAWGGRRTKVRKGSRVDILRRFLIDEFTLDALSKGSGVLDVACGNGEFAFQLLNLNGVHVTCVDPRPLCLHKAKTKWNRGMYWFNPIWRPWNGDKPAEDVVPRNPSHLRILFDDDLTQWSQEVAEKGVCTPELLLWLRQSLESAQRLSWTRQGLSKDTAGDADYVQRRPPSYYPTHLHREFADREVIDEENSSIKPVNDASEGEEGQHDFITTCLPEDVDAAEAFRIAKAITDCSAIVGMHPDQATGHIVEYAVAAKKAFAVVPCCVYSAAFPKRKLADGTPVKTRAQLIAYLMGLRPGIRSKTLDFEGQNVVVYWSPSWAE